MFLYLAIVTHAAINTSVQIHAQILSSSAYGSVRKSGISGSSGISVFNFLRNQRTIFHSRCPILNCHQQRTWFPIFLHSRQHLFYFASGVILNECEVVSPCSFDLLFSNVCDVEHLFMWFLAICISSLEKYLFKSYIDTYIGVLIYSGYYSHIRYMIENIFRHSVGCIFPLLLVLFHVQKFLISVKSILSTFSFVSCAVDVISKKSLLYPTSWSFSSVFSS